MLKVSVIIPVFNSEKFISSCVESVLNQTFKNIEIILIDDGSTDNSPLLCDEFALRDSRVTVIHKKNRGVSDARNVGVINSSGDYVFFLDSDDYLHCRTISDMVNRIKTPNGIVICGYKKISKYANGEGVMGLPIIREYTPHDYIREILLRHRTTYVWGALYPRELAYAVKFPEGVFFEDLYVFSDFIIKSDSIICMDNEYYFYRQVPTSIMGTLNLNKLNDYYNACDNLISNSTMVYDDLAQCSVVLKCYVCLQIINYMKYKKIEDGLYFKCIDDISEYYYLFMNECDNTKLKMLVCLQRRFETIYNVLLFFKKKVLG